MSSNVTPSLEKRPPWRTRYFDPTRVARGSALNVSENILKTRSLYLYRVSTVKGVFFSGERTLIDTLLRSRRLYSCRLFRGCHG